jgi:hypothetical protein
MSTILSQHSWRMFGSWRVTDTGEQNIGEFLAHHYEFIDGDCASGGAVGLCRNKRND